MFSLAIGILFTALPSVPYYGLLSFVDEKKDTENMIDSDNKKYDLE